MRRTLGLGADDGWSGAPRTGPSRLADALVAAMGADAVARFVLGVGRRISRVTAAHVNGSPGLVFHASRGDYLYVVEHDDARITGIQVHATPPGHASV